MNKTTYKKLIMALTVSCANLSTLAYANTPATASLDKLGELMMGILSAIGVLVLIWGAGKFAMAIKNEDAHSMQGAFLYIASGALLIATPILVASIK